jgi:glycerol-3-phosphate dehydrogenase (NAD(P)+)
MSIITITGAGMMGSALCWPLADNGHTVRLVGTPLDTEIIAGLRANRFHPKLQRALPEGVAVYDSTQLAEALEGAELVASGVSSFGVEWFASAVGPHLRLGMPVVAVTKGLEDQPDGTLLTLPAATARRLPVQVSLNAIGGPCIAHELAARRQTAVVFTGADEAVLAHLRDVFSTPYYHIWTSTDVTGVEVCAAMKNAYALGVGLGVGMMEKAGPDGLANMYNPQAALFAQSCFEMGRLLQITGGGMDNIAWLPGPGDLYVTVFGGRTVRLGKLLGQGHTFAEAREMMAGETLESVEITTRVARALPKLAARGLARLEDFPLLLHLDEILNHAARVYIPWGRFFERKALRD